MTIDLHNRVAKYALTPIAPASRLRWHVASQTARSRLSLAFAAIASGGIGRAHSGRKEGRANPAVWLRLPSWRSVRPRKTAG